MNKELLDTPFSAPDEQDQPADNEGQLLDSAGESVIPEPGTKEEMQPLTLDACNENCGHPKCANGCNFPRVGAAACGMVLPLIH